MLLQRRSDVAPCCHSSNSCLQTAKATKGFMRLFLLLWGPPFPHKKMHFAEFLLETLQFCCKGCFLLTHLCNVAAPQSP